VTTTDGNSSCIVVRVIVLHFTNRLYWFPYWRTRIVIQQRNICFKHYCILRCFLVLCDYARPSVCYISARYFAQIQFLQSRLSSFRIQYNMPSLIFRTNWRSKGPIFRHTFHNYLSTYIKMLKLRYQSRKYTLNFMNFQHLGIGIMNFPYYLEKVGNQCRS
jgi:hypothetical protein